MSGGACAVIIGDGEQVKALAQQTVNLWTLEMQRKVSWTPEQRARFHSDLRRARSILERALTELTDAAGPPHDLIDSQG
jgi:hypothetical protein